MAKVNNKRLGLTLGLCVGVTMLVMGVMILTGQCGNGGVGSASQCNSSNPRAVENMVISLANMSQAEALELASSLDLDRIRDNTQGRVREALRQVDLPPRARAEIDRALNNGTSLNNARDDALNEMIEGFSQLNNLSSQNRKIMGYVLTAFGALLTLVTIAGLVRQ